MIVILLDTKLAIAAAAGVPVHFERTDYAHECVIYTYRILSDDGTRCTIMLSLKICAENIAKVHIIAAKIRARILDISGSSKNFSTRVFSVTEASGGEVARDRFGMTVLPCAFVVTGRSQGVRGD